MADNRKEYTVDIGRVPHTMLLSPEDAKRLGAKPVEQKQVKPANKQGKPAADK